MSAPEPSPQSGLRRRKEDALSSMHSTQHPGQIGHLTGKFSGVEPREFRDSMNELWQSAHSITQSVAEEVEAGRISPVQGASVVANVTGSIFGWTEFYREFRLADLAGALVGQVSGDGQ